MLVASRALPIEIADAKCRPEAWHRWLQEVSTNITIIDCMSTFMHECHQTRCGIFAHATRILDIHETFLDRRISKKHSRSDENETNGMVRHQSPCVPARSHPIMVIGTKAAILQSAPRLTCQVTAAIRMGSDNTTGAGAAALDTGAAGDAGGGYAKELATPRGSPFRHITGI
jgi:hypothetical protein